MDQRTTVAVNPGLRVTLAMIARAIADGRRLVWIITACTTALALAIAILGTPRYDAKLILAPATSDSGGLEGAIGGGLGGLAALAGLGGGRQDVDQTLVILQSQTFLQQFLVSENVLPVLYPHQWDAVNKRWHPDVTFAGRVGAAWRRVHSWISPDPQAPPGDGSPDLWEAYRRFSSLISTELDKRTHLVTLSVGWKDPVVAAHWANELVRRINNETRARAVAESEANLNYVAEQLGRTQVFELRQALYHIAESEQKHAMVANTHEDFALRVLARAEVPRERSFPKRTVLVLGGVIGGLVLGALVVLARAMLIGSMRGYAQPM
jgi:uncharacterized protein involved in exopolysaccharide biosynthesis